MSKKTRKKSPGTSPAKGSRRGPKNAQKLAKTRGRASAATSAGAAAKSRTKTGVKTVAKQPGKTPAKAPPKTRKAPSKAPSAARAQTAAPKVVAKSNGTAAKLEPVSKTSANETVATPAAKVLAAPVPASSRSMAAMEGAAAPEFDLPRDGGQHVSLSDYSGRKLVIFFYPRADTPGCTKEAIDFTRLRDDFAAAGTEVLGVSADPLKAQEAFRNKHQLATPLISDEAHQMLQAYGAWGEKSMYGRTFEGVLRTTVLIDANGRIAKIWRGVKVDGHADAVLAAAREL